MRVGGVGQISENNANRGLLHKASRCVIHASNFIGMFA